MNVLWMRWTVRNRTSTVDVIIHNVALSELGKALVGVIHITPD